MIANRVLMIVALLISFPLCAQETASKSKEDKLYERAAANRLALEFDGKSFSGPAWDRLLEEGKVAQFFLVGEEHGIAENPKLVAQLFAALSESGYSKLAIEISPTMASLLDKALAEGGMDGLRELYAEPGGQPAFFGMAEESEMLAAIKAAAGPGPMFWGTDYEVVGDRQLIGLLQQAEKPAAAATALKALAEASTASWAKYEETRSPQYIFSFAGDPALVKAVRDSWPQPDARSATILHTLEGTLTINNLWVQGKAWESNSERAQLQRHNFLRFWRSEKERALAPKVIAKYGASHLVRGRSRTGVYDLGTLLPELAALEGGHSYSIMIVPGANSEVAVLNPSAWRYEAKAPKDGYLDGIEPLVRATYDDTFTLIDLRALRPVAGMNRGSLDEDLFRTIHGFDALLVMTGSTPSRDINEAAGKSE